MSQTTLVIDFMARVIIDPDESYCNVTVWVHRLNPENILQQPYAETVKEHLEGCYEVSDFKEMFHLEIPEGQQCEVLFKGTYRGYWSWSQDGSEWDADIDIEEGYESRLFKYPEPMES